MGFVKTDIYDLQFNPYKLIGKDWFSSYQRKQV